MRNKLLVAAVVLVGLASVAYAAFTQTLTISGTGTVTGDWSVEITSITRTAGTAGATDAASTPSRSATTATFDVSFATPGDYATYDVVITNKGSIPAKLTSLPDLTTINVAEPADVKFTIVSGPALNDILNNNDTATVKVKAEWLSSAVSNPTTVSKTASIEYGFTQSP